MSRSSKILIGILLVLCGAAVIGVAVLADDPAVTRTCAIVALLFAVPGLWLGISSARAGLPPEVRGRVAMRFRAATLITGLVLAGACILTPLLLWAALGILTKGAIFVPIVGVPMGLLIAARAWAPSCVRCDRALDSRQFHTRGGEEGTKAKRALESRDPVALARSVAGASSRVDMAEMNGSPIVVESCPGCGRVAFAWRGGTSAWFLDQNAQIVLDGARKASL